LLPDAAPAGIGVGLAPELRILPELNIEGVGKAGRGDCPGFIAIGTGTDADAAADDIALGKGFTVACTDEVFCNVGAVGVALFILKFLSNEASGAGGIAAEAIFVTSGVSLATVC
jgi:hypothetical protein